MGGLKEAFLVPAQTQKCVEGPFANDITDLRGITPPEGAETGVRGLILEPHVRVSFKKRDIPLEGDIESGACLTFSILPVSVQNLKVEFILKRPKPRDVILYGMSGKNPER